MPSRLHYVLATGFITANLLAAPIERPVSPDALFSKYNGMRRPLFVATSAAFDSQGGYTSALPSEWRAQHERISHLSDRAMAAPRAPQVKSDEAPGACRGIQMGEPQVESMVTRDTMESTIQHADGIFVGTIAEVTPGFFNAGPASLLRLNNLRIIKRTPAYKNVANTLFARYSYAHFSAGNRQYCLNSSSSEPHVGDRVMVFAFGPPLDEGGVFVYSFENDVILQDDKGVHLPRLLQPFSAEVGGSLGALATFLDRRVRDEARQ
jgi:hypothetical protein